MSFLEKDKIMKILIIILTTIIIMITSSIIIYNNISKPKFYDNFMSLGNKYLQQEKYTESISVFRKAIIIEPKSTDAILGMAKGYVGIEDINKAINLLKQAQQINIENEKLLLEILNILKDIDLEKGYEFLQNYIDKVDKSSISFEVKELIELSKEKPSNPIPIPKSGSYIKPIDIKFTFDKTMLGSTIYYTVDGSNPNKNSHKYTGKIKINEDTQLKLIVYNIEGQSNDIIQLDYIIDSELLSKLEILIEECEDKLNKTQEGTNVGNCIDGAKETFNIEIQNAKNLVTKNIISCEDANQIYINLENSLQEFNNKIIEETNRTQLKNTIDKAKSIYDKSVEGKKDGNYKIGSKVTLMNAIKESENIYNEILSRQSDIDSSVSNLKKAINVFEGCKVVTFNKDIAMNMVINKYGPQVKHENCGPDNPDAPTYKENTCCIHTYEFVSDMLVDNNGLRYYKIHWYDSFCNEYHIFINELKVYENGTIIDKQIF